MKEALELREPTEMYFAQPLELLSNNSILKTKVTSTLILRKTVPNGRFELNKKICLSISGYHPETWLPSWSIRTALLALIGFMPTAGAGALGSLEYPVAERKKLAKKSLEWKCKECGACMKDALKPLTEDAKKSNEEAKELASQLSFKDEEEKKAAIAEAEESTPASVTDNMNNDGNQANGIVGEEVVSVAAEQTQQPSTSPNQQNQQPQTPIITANRSIPAVYSDSESYASLFITVPICVVFLSLFALLLARRFLLEV
ncbi:hypothetical protein NECAME_12565 [Necator americanus]|uniref:Ubiquitin--protein ligase n=1 Tax=Necator americanus TaxID=51031 RepID=W2T0C5_NECAM|nr:hypothetical protein NECAME_12565 [Necator americanus]ETN75014.1 hypothetical protein NECAME_12565 [Necator americanus]